MLKAIFPGSFNPFTIGHKNILDKAINIFGKENTMVAIGCNPAKIDISNFEDKSKSLSSKLEIPVISYTCYLHELILKYENEGFDVVLIRGLRSNDDLAYEENQLKFIKDFLKKENPNYELRVVFIMCDEKYKHISSSAVRQLEAFKEGSGIEYVI